MSKYDKTTTLNSYFRYPPLITEESKIIGQRKLYEADHKLVTHRLVDQTCYMGIEVEVEKVPPFPPIIGWNPTPDGSLRNNGMEFVSTPVRGQNVHYLLHSLMGHLKAGGAEFTERTSIHVHMNVRRLTIEQLVTLLITYIVVEKSIYRFIHKAGFERSRNIFCVPLSESQHYLGVPYLVYLLKQNEIGALVDSIHDFWRKYSGLNLLPITTQGTVEFRQLGGTFDTNLILDWINIIQSLRTFALQTTLEQATRLIFDLNTNSNYQNFLRMVFGQYADRMSPGYGEKFGELEAGIMNVKEAFMLRENFGITKERFQKSSVKQYVENMLGQIPEFSMKVYTDEIKHYEALIAEITKSIPTLKGEKLRTANAYIAMHHQNIAQAQDKMRSYDVRRAAPKKSIAMVSIYRGVR